MDPASLTPKTSCASFSRYLPLPWWLAAFLAMLGLVAAAAAAEQLDRGVVAFPNREGHVYVGWRLLESDPPDVAFEVYRSDTPTGARHRITTTPIVDSTNVVDREARAAGRRGFHYVVRALAGGRTLSESAPVTVGRRGTIGGLMRVRLQGDYGVQKAGVADLDGDGRLDYVVKQPNFNSDPYVLGKGYWKPSPEPYKLEAYRHDGTFLWRYDMGPGIETGVWYSPVVVYDIDGDGRAEVYCKAGPTDSAELVRHPDGMVMGGPEFLVKLDGATGREQARLPWPDRDGIRHRFAGGALADYNYQSRNLLGVAYLDGRRPHLIVQRGTYTLIKIRAYDPQLNLAWSFDAAGDHAAYQGQGAHGFQVADIDDDGRDELVIGAAALDDDGQPLWTTGRGHPDACYVGRIDPSRPGLQVFLGHEWRQTSNGLCLLDARTGQTLWGYRGPTTHVHSSGMVADIDPTRPGMESYGGEANGTQFWLYDAKGNRIGDQPMGGLAPRAVWWADGPVKLVVAGGRLFRFQPPTPADAEALAAKEAAPRTTVGAVVRGLGAAAAGRPSKVTVTEVWSGYVAEEYGPIEGTIVGLADILGDWREELIVSVEGELRLHSTTLPATTRRVCLLQDRQYRTAVAMQTMGYLYPPMLGREF